MMQRFNEGQRVKFTNDEHSWARPGDVGVVIKAIHPHGTFRTEFTYRVEFDSERLRNANADILTVRESDLDFFE